MNDVKITGKVTASGVVRGKASIPMLSSDRTLDINSNGIFNVLGYRDVNVQVPPNVGEKVITANGIYLSSDDNIDGYSRVVAEVVRGSAILTPYAFDYIDGYVNGGVFNRVAGETNNRNDIYRVVAGRKYKFTYGNTVGNRSRIMLTVDDVTQIGGTGAISRGTSLSESVSPSRTWDMYFESSLTGYLIVTKDNRSTSDIPTFLLDMTALGD